MHVEYHYYMQFGDLAPWCLISFFDFWSNFKVKSEILEESSLKTIKAITAQSQESLIQIAGFPISEQRYGFMGCEVEMNRNN